MFRAYFWAICILFLGNTSLLATSMQSEKHSLKIISYNVLYGFNHRKSERLATSWLQQQDADVVAFQELNGISQAQLQSLAQTWGHQHAVILKEKGFPVGLSAKQPIQVIRKRLDGLHHGYLHCTVDGIHYIVVHLSPFSYKRRLKETALILQDLKEIINTQATVILGDFNALSPLDTAQHQENTTLLEFLQAKEQANKKIQNLNQGTYDYSVMNMFLQNGFHDPIPQSLLSSKEPYGTLPTSILTETVPQPKQLLRRIDYILLNKHVSYKTKHYVIAQHDVLDSISDHYPVVLSLTK